MSYDEQEAARRRAIVNQHSNAGVIRNLSAQETVAVQAIAEAYQTSTRTAAAQRHQRNRAIIDTVTIVVFAAIVIAAMALAYHRGVNDAQLNQQSRIMAAYAIGHDDGAMHRTATDADTRNMLRSLK